MAIITEVPEETPNKPRPRRKTQQQPESSASIGIGIVNGPNSGETYAESLRLLVLPGRRGLTHHPPLRLLLLPIHSRHQIMVPQPFREHYSRGRTLKIQMARQGLGLREVEISAVDKGPALAEAVLFVHGYGTSSYPFRDVVSDLGSRGVTAVAMGLPGIGFSDKAVVVEEDVVYGAMERFRDVYGEIKEKGLFYAFDQIVETGQMPYHRIESPQMVRRKSARLIELGDEEVSKGSEPSH